MFQTFLDSLYDPLGLLDVYRDPLAHPLMLALWWLATGVVTGIVLYRERSPRAFNPLQEKVDAGEVNEANTRLFYRPQFPFRRLPEEFERENEKTRDYFRSRGFEIAPTTGVFLGHTV